MSLVMFAAMGLAPVSYALAGVFSEVNDTFLFSAAGAVVLAATLFATRGPVRSIQ
jgi:hypothetical protein